MAEWAAVLRRIQGLLALASEDGGGTEEERDAAAAKAQSLMLKYRVSQDDLAGAAGRESLPGIEREFLGLFKQGSMWQKDLYHAVSVPVGVDTLYSSGLRGKRLSLVGRPDAIAYVKTMVEWLLPQLELECAAALVRQKEENPRLFTLIEQGGWAYSAAEIAAATMEFKKSFYEHASEQIGWRLTAAAAREPGTDLVRSDKAAMDEFYGERKPKQVEHSPYDGIGAGAGMSAGREADLNPDRRVGAADNRQIEDRR